MVSLPLWAVFAVGFGSPVLSFLGVVFAQWLGRKAARELESRSRREETMRTMRWAAELAVSEDDGPARLGLAQLDALGDSAMLDDDQQLFVDAALTVVLGGPIAEVRAAGPGVEVDSAADEDVDGDGSTAPLGGVPWGQDDSGWTTGAGDV